MPLSSFSAEMSISAWRWVTSSTEKGRRQHLADSADTSLCVTHPEIIYRLRPHAAQTRGDMWAYMSRKNSLQGKFILVPHECLGMCEFGRLVVCWCSSLWARIFSFFFGSSWLEWSTEQRLVTQWRLDVHNTPLGQGTIGRFNVWSIYSYNRENYHISVVRLLCTNCKNTPSRNLQSSYFIGETHGSTANTCLVYKHWLASQVITTHLQSTAGVHVTLSGNIKWYKMNRLTESST